MEIKYEKDLYNSFMIMPSNEINNDYFFKMICYEEIPNILKVEQRVINNKASYYYDISNKKSIEEMRKLKPFEYEDLLIIILGILDGIEIMGEYLLKEDELIINESLIYIQDKNVYLTYMPGYKGNIKESLIKIIEYLMNNISYKDKQAVLVIYEIYSELKEDFKLSIVREKLNREINVNFDENIVYNNDDYIKKVNKIPVMEEKIVSETEKETFSLNQYIYSVVSVLVAIVLIYVIIKLGLVNNKLNNKINFEKLLLLIVVICVVLGYINLKIWNKRNRITKIIEKNEYESYEERNQYEYEPIIYNKQSLMTESIESIHNNYDDSETCLLTESSSNYGYYIRPYNDESKIYISKFPFTIGKLGGQVDFFINNNTVSRYHARIEIQDSNIYLTDLNSTNGTKINDKKINAYEKIVLNDNDKLTFSNSEYIYAKE